MTSCPDWAWWGEVRGRDEAAAHEAEWDLVRAHLGECSRCRVRAVAADPSLALLGAGAVDVGAGEAALIKQAVHSLRRVRVLERKREEAGTGATGGWRRVAVLAMAVGLVWLSGVGEWPDPREMASSLMELPFAPAVESSDVRLEMDGPISVIEDLNRPHARVYQLIEVEPSVVWIVDETFDL